MIKSIHGKNLYFNRSEYPHRRFCTWGVHNFLACGQVLFLLMFLAGCTVENRDVSSIQDSDIHGVWLATYSACNAHIKSERSPMDYGVASLTGYEILTFFQDGTYSQIFELRENGEWQNLTISGERWSLDDDAIIHLGSGAWPTAGLEYAQDFEQGVDILREGMGVLMTDRDVLLSANIRRGDIQLQHAIDASQDPDSPSCGFFRKIK